MNKWVKYGIYGVVALVGIWVFFNYVYPSLSNATTNNAI